MDQVKIGKFILELRKEKQMTQQELASRLGVTDRAVSNWENGRRMPDVSLLKPLADILGISVNELFVGEKIPKEKQLSISEENLLETLQTANRVDKKSRKLLIFLAVVVLLLCFIVFLHFQSTYPKINVDDLEVYVGESDEEYVFDRAFTYDERNVYYYGVDEVLVCDKKQLCYELENSLKHKQVTLDKIKAYFEEEALKEHITASTLYDGGTTIYSNDDFTAIFCQTTDGNQDIYFGETGILDELDGSYCGHAKSEIKKFTRTYEIKAIQKLNDEQVEVLLSDQTGEATVTFSSTYPLVVGQRYAFTFSTFVDYEDGIANVFENSHIERVRKTDRLIHEPIVVSVLLQMDGLNEVSGVQMTIKDGTLTPNGATIIITDYSGEDYLFGSWYRLDKKVGGDWQAVDVVLEGNYGWDDIGYRPDENDYLVLNVDWTWLYGTLETGEYRLVKSISRLENSYFSVSFTID